MSLTNNLQHEPSKVKIFRLCYVLTVINMNKRG